MPTGAPRARRLLWVLVCFTAIGLAGSGSHILGSVLVILRVPLLVALGVVGWRRGPPWRPALVAGACALALVGQWFGTRLRRAELPAGDPAAGRRLTLLSHNILFEGGDPDRTLKGLRSREPDVLVLQEVTSAWTNRLEATLPGRFPYRALAARVGAHGYAVYSRYPLRGEALLSEGGPPAFAQCVEVLLPGRVLPLCNVHFHAAASAVAGAR